MGVDLRPFVANALALLTLALLHGLGGWVAPPAMASSHAGAMLFIGCLLAFVVTGLCRGRRWNVSAWLATAFYAALLAAIFYGANAGLNVLHGRHRQRPDVASLIGGLELWFVLCPGLVSVALSRALCRAITAPETRCDERQKPNE